jgi:hypothetical protein
MAKFGTTNKTINVSINFPTGVCTSLTYIYIYIYIYIPENSQTEKMGLIPQFNLYSFESLGICPNNREAVVVDNWFDDHVPIVCVCFFLPRFCDGAEVVIIHKSV